MEVVEMAQAAQDPISIRSASAPPALIKWHHTLCHRSSPCDVQPSAKPSWLLCCC